MTTKDTLHATAHTNEPLMPLKLKGNLVEKLDHQLVIENLHEGMTYEEVAEKHSNRIGESVSRGTIHRIAKHYNRLKKKDASLSHMTEKMGLRLGWACGRPMAKYKGSYPNGFLRRVDALMEVQEGMRMLHLFSGSIQGREDEDTMDISPDNLPTFVADARERFPMPAGCYDIVMADPPYDMVEQGTGKTVTIDYSDKLWKTETVKPYCWVNEAIRVLKPGGFLLVLHHLVYITPKNTTRAGVVSVTCGPNTRIRCLSIFRKHTEMEAKLNLVHKL
jgi:SAM-dependent methyltransferase